MPESGLKFDALRCPTWLELDDLRLGKPAAPEGIRFKEAFQVLTAVRAGKQNATYAGDLPS